MIRIVAIGKLNEKALDSLQKEYLKRLGAFCKTEVIEVKDEPERKNKPLGQIIEAEGQRALERIRKDEFVVLLDLEGKMVDSVEFSRLRSGWMEQKSHLCFVIAGSNGPSPALKKRADWKWKLSDLTFPHTLCRILVLEQLYRSFMIEANRTYHK